jgi:hypothetical protein
MEDTEVIFGDRLNAVYTGRNQLVAALSKLFISHLGPVSDAEPGWGTAVYIQLPSGQVSWHISDEEVETLFSHLSVDTTVPWDGHTTDEKYQRLSEITVQLPRMKGVTA